jgi:hypothetical protein
MDVGECCRGALRIAKDFVLLTKKDGLLTALLLSRSFHEKNGLKEVTIHACPLVRCTLTRASFKLTIEFTGHRAVAVIHDQW